MLKKFEKIRKNLKKNNWELGNWSLGIRKGFTLVESIIYIAIASIFFTTAIGFFWQMRTSEVRADVSVEVKENAAQVLEAFKYQVRNADSVSVGKSGFGVNPGSLVLIYPDGERVFYTYNTQVIVGGREVGIQKLVLAYGGANYDLTSDHVNITKFQVNNFTLGAQPPVLQMELDLENVNPGADSDYDDSISVRTTVNVREG